jgi:hypothetical protein
MPENSSAILDATIKRQSDVVRLGESLGRKANATIKDTETELKGAIAVALLEIGREPTKANFDKLQALQKRLAKIRRKGFDEAQDEMLTQLNKIAEDQPVWLLALLGALGLSVARDAVPTAIMLDKIVLLQAYAGRTYAQWWRSARAADMERIMLSIRSGLTGALTDREIVERIFGSKTMAGALTTTANEVGALTGTMTSGVAGGSLAATAARSGAFDRVLWVSVLDSRTSQICRGLSGMVWGIDEMHPVPPQHARCRSTLSYILQGESVPDVPDYDTWIRNQPEKEQKAILPRWQYEAMQKGAKLSQFITGNLKPMTMREFLISEQ